MTRTGACGLIILGGILCLPAVTQAQPQVEVPVGTKVALRFLTGLDARTAVQDQRVNFRVAVPTTVNRRTVLREGTAAHGFVVSVIGGTAPRAGVRIRIAFVETTAVDGQVVRLARIEVMPEAFRQVKDPAAAVATSAVGTIMLGDGTSSTAFVQGEHLVVPAGAVAVTATTHSIVVTIP